MPRKPPATRKAGPVGRDDVLAELRRVVDEAVAGRGHLLLLAGASCTMSSAVARAGTSSAASLTSGR